MYVDDFFTLKWATWYMSTKPLWPFSVAFIKLFWLKCAVRRIRYQWNFREKIIKIIQTSVPFGSNFIWFYIRKTPRNVRSVNVFVPFTMEKMPQYFDDTKMFPLAASYQASLCMSLAIPKRQIKRNRRIHTLLFRMVIGKICIYETSRQSTFNSTLSLHSELCNQQMFHWTIEKKLIEIWTQFWSVWQLWNLQSCGRNGTRHWHLHVNYYRINIHRNVKLNKVSVTVL